MPAPQVSVVIPSRNEGTNLAYTVHWILANTRQPEFEIIVVDDGSTDRTVEVARSFGKAVRLVLQEHRGVSAARNHGARVARGDLLAFLDADDLYVPQKLAQQLARFVARPELELSAAYTVNFWSPELAEHARDHDPKMTAPWPRHISTWMMRRCLFERIGPFDETMPLSQDVDWHLRAASHGVVSETLPDVLTRRRLHLGNVTRHTRADCRAAVLDSLRGHLARRRAR
jgi:glycosyltransferase involved in cell wall biosynthesis